MQYQQYAIEMELTGITRKRAAELMSEVFGKPYVYDNADDSYSVADSFGRGWAVETASDITRQKYSGDRVVGANLMYAVKINSPLIYQRDFENVPALMKRLQNAGAIVNDSTKLSVNISAKNHTEKSLQNLVNIMESKGDLIYKAVQSRQPGPVTKTEMGNESVVRFPMFNSTLSADKIQSYVHLAAAVNHQAVTQNNVSPKKNDSPNDKFTFRTWLIRLGMVGSEYKTTRAVLLENLEGNTAWKNPEMAPRHREAVTRNQSAQPESPHKINATEQMETEVMDEPDQSMSFGLM